MAEERGHDETENDENRDSGAVVWPSSSNCYACETCHVNALFMAWLIGSHEPTHSPRGQGHKPRHHSEPQDDVCCGIACDLDGFCEP